MPPRLFNVANLKCWRNDSFASGIYIEIVGKISCDSSTRSATDRSGYPGHSPGRLNEGRHRNWDVERRGE